MTAADVDKIREPDAVITAQERQEAGQTAERIRQGLESIAPLVERAWRDRHWEKLGYQDWAAYVAGEFGEHRIEARRAVAALLSGEGLSVRQISEATGVPRSTVSDDLRTGVSEAPDTSADQAKRNAGVTRKPKPKTGAQRVREHRERKRTRQEAHDPDCQCEACSAARPTGYKPPPSTPDPEPPKPDCVHRYELICRDCGARVPERDVLAMVDQREDELAALREEAGTLKERAAGLEETIAALRAKLQIGSDGAVQAGPHQAAASGSGSADSPPADAQAPPEPKARRGARTTCGSPDAGKFRFVAGGRLMRLTMPDGRQAGELWLCGEHQEEMTERFGAEVDLDPAGDDDPFAFGEPCEFPVRAEVPA